MQNTLKKLDTNAKKIIEKYAIQKDRRSEQEFLPAALSILETPPSPVHITLIWLIAALVILALFWSVVGKLDVIAIAQGKIQPAGRVKTIQPLETGRVISLFVENGKHVKVGDVLVELDTAEAKADETASEKALLSYKAEKIRREIALDHIKKNEYKTSPEILWNNDIPDLIQQRESRVSKAEFQQLIGNVESFDAQIQQKKNEIERLKNTIVSQESLISTLQQRVSMRKSLLSRGSTTKAAVIDAMESLQTQQTALAQQKGQLAEAESSYVVLQKDRQKSIDTFSAENEKKLNEAERQIDELQQRNVKAHEKKDHMIIKSPIDGSIIGLSITSKNQVVASGEELMRVVPDDTGLEVECYAQNKDIGFIKFGQEAVVKLEAFPFTRFGVIEAKVINVAHDAIPEPDAQSIESNPAKSNKSRYFGGAQRTQNLVYPIILKLSRSSMRVGDMDVPLTAGMAATVEISIGKRRIIDYVISPLLETTSQAMRER